MKLTKNILGAALAGICGLCAPCFPNIIGVGARSLGMANNFVAVPGDLSAMYWNPGALAFLPIREFLISTDGLLNNAKADFNGTSESSDLPQIRIANAGLVRALPTDHGGFTFAFGFQSPYIFDDVVSFQGNYGAGPISISKDYRTYGSLNMWSGGFGIQVAEGVGLGLVASLVTGDDHEHQVFLETVNGSIPDPVDNNNYDRLTDRSYVGYDLRFGCLYTPVDKIHVGLRLTIPQNIWFSESFNETYPNTAEPSYGENNLSGLLTSSYTGALGVSAELPFMTLSSEVHARAPYSLIYPSENIPESSPAKRFIIGGGIGIEAPVLRTLLLRAGYAYNEYDLFIYEKKYTDEALDWGTHGIVADPSHLLTVGIGYVVGSVCFEGSYGYEFWHLTTNGTLSEDHSQQRLLLSFSFRY